ncbi:MAG: GNAT family N-acetyltransferase [Acidobacteriota bacterium]
MTGPPFERRRDAFTISTDPALLDREAIRAFLAQSYWAAGIPQEVVDRSIEGSLPFGLYEEGRQIGLARVITDRATFAYVADVYVLESHRGRGLGVWLLETIHAHPDLRNLRRWMLATRDAHALYRKTGWAPLAQPDRFMEIAVPDIYSKPRPPKD